MKRLLFSFPLAGCLIILGMATATYAQTEALVITSTTLDQKAIATISKSYLMDDKMVVESGDEKQQQSVLFDGGKETFYIINHKKKEYTEMTRQDMEALSTMVQQQMATIEKQIEMMPANQRAMIREKMGAAFGAGQKPAEYALEESGVKIKGWTTDKYIGSADGKKQSEIYIAKFTELGQQAEDFETIGNFFNLMKEYMQGMTKNLPSMNLGFFGEGLPDYKDGVPVKSIIYNQQEEPISTSTVDSITEEAVDEKIFSVPEHYQEKELSIN